MSESSAGSETPTVVAVDQGTSSTKAVALDGDGRIIRTESVPVAQSHPRPGWVEQDAEQIAASVESALERIAAGSRGSAGALALSTQRESAVIWDPRTGQPLGPVLGWQDRRTREEAQRLIGDGHGEQVRRISGLPIDPMFSALKFAWLLDEVDPDRSASRRGEVALGTVDSWIVFKLTGEHRIEAGNASRTQLMSLDTLDWSEELLELFRVPRRALPRITASNAATEPMRSPVRGVAAGIHAVLADSHAALYAHGITAGGIATGDVKVTYGTGSSIMGLSETITPVGLTRTLAWHDGVPRYAYEGNILSTGATLVWLANLLEISPSELTSIAERARPDHGLEFVPAFAGLAAPWWDEDAQAIICGLSLGSDRGSIARAAVESIALQVEDVLSAVDAHLERGVRRVFVDGGPTANPWLVQLQADISQRSLIRSNAAELSAVGVGLFAGLATGAWTTKDLSRLGEVHSQFDPRMASDAAAARRSSWLHAVGRARGTPAPVPQQA